MMALMFTVASAFRRVGNNVRAHRPNRRIPIPRFPIPDSRFPIPDSRRGIAHFTRYTDIHVQAIMTITAAKTRLLSLIPATAILLAVVLGIWESGTMIARM